MKLRGEQKDEELRGEVLGVVVRGSLSEGLEMRLAPEKSVEELRAGRFVVIRGEKNRFFALLSDVQLAAIHPDILLSPPAPEERLRRAVLSGTGAYGMVKLRPQLMLPADSDDDDPESLQPVRTVPVHFSPVEEATQDDVRRVFGDERKPEFFHVGEPLDMETPVCLNLDRWIERSNAIFGKSGTGKTFLTRLCLCGAIRAQKAVHLIFDMHSEYGWEATSEQQGRPVVRGLKQYFGDRVQIFTLDPESSRRRGVRPDAEVLISYSDIEPEDILLLQNELNLNATAAESIYALERILRKEWFKQFLDMEGEDLNELAERSNLHTGALSALQRKLQTLVSRCSSFLKPDLPPGSNPVQSILSQLKMGKNVALEFGSNDNPTQYMLVANILTRRLHDIYRKETEQAMGGKGEKPRPLVIVIEEAHKFLAPDLADQTIFGTIAREMRKFNVTLLLVDQRPSGIDSETLSQVGTRICCLLDDEKDVAAALSGIAGASALRSVLASLETRQQALIFGHAVPMPVVVRTRTYDDRGFREAMGTPADGEESSEALIARMQRDIEKDF